MKTGTIEYEDWHDRIYGYLHMKTGTIDCEDWHDRLKTGTIDL